MCRKSFIFSAISILISSLLFFSGTTVSAQPAPRGPHIGPLFVEDLGMVPDPVRPGQEVRFRARIRNDGNPIRANIRIQDRDQVVAELNNASLNHGTFDYWFVQAPYQFQRLDHCFTVIVDVERTRHRVDATREFCAKPWGWTLVSVEGPGPAHLSRIEGLWFVNCNNVTGKIEFHWTGNAWTGRLWFDVVPRWEELTDVFIDPRTGQVRFVRHGNPPQQYYGTLSGNRIEGTFGPPGAPQAFPWTAWRQ